MALKLDDALARNQEIITLDEQEAKTGTLIQDFEAKILDFFQYVRNDKDGERAKNVKDQFSPGAGSIDVFYQRLKTNLGGI